MKIDESPLEKLILEIIYYAIYMISTCMQKSLHHKTLFVAQNKNKNAIVSFHGAFTNAIFPEAIIGIGLLL